MSQQPSQPQSHEYQYPKVTPTGSGAPSAGSVVLPPKQR